MAQPQNIQIKVDDETLKGKYSNMMQVSHTKQEFILDFMSVFPPTGIVVSRVITRPEHFKGIIKALEENLKRYEDQHGEVIDVAAPEQKFGFQEK